MCRSSSFLSPHYISNNLSTINGVVDCQKHIKFLTVVEQRLSFCIRKMTYCSFSRSSQSRAFLIRYTNKRWIFVVNEATQSKIETSIFLRLNSTNFYCDSTQPNPSNQFTIQNPHPPIDTFTDVREPATHYIRTYRILI